MWVPGRALGFSAREPGVTRRVCVSRAVVVIVAATMIVPAATAAVVGHPNQPTAAAPNAVPRLVWLATWAANTPPSNRPRQTRVTAVFDRQVPSTTAAAAASTSPARITRRAPTRSVQTPATRVATMPSSPAPAYAPIRSGEYENGGCDSATAMPAHTAQNAKNQRVPRPAASRSSGKRRQSSGSPRSVAR